MSSDGRRHIPGLWDRDAEALIAEVVALRAALTALVDATDPAYATFVFGGDEMTSAETLDAARDNAIAVLGGGNDGRP